MKHRRAESIYDLTVVGGGPAGSTTARIAAEKGVNVLLIDRELEIGVPNKCGEFIPSFEEMKRLAPKVIGLEDYFDPPSSCIVNRTKYVKFIFPNYEEIVVPFRGVIVERKILDKHLANEAARAGAKILTKNIGVDLLKNMKGVKVKSGNKIRDVPSKNIVGADGAYSLIARRAGLPVSRDPLDYGVGYQYEMVNIDHDPDYVEMYLGEDIAPGTYAWIIPKGGDIANVGTGVRAPYMKRGLNIRDYQRNFLEKHPISSEKLKKAVPTAIKAGCIPVGGPMDRTTVKNIIAVGDAGGHTIPTVGGGIPPAMICGGLAGKAISDHLFDGKPLNDFDSAWKDQLGVTLENSLRLRKISDVVFRNKRMIDLITKRGWLTEEMVEKFIFCRIDKKMKIVEKTLGIMKRI